LSGIAEYLHADNTVLRKENAEIKGMLNTGTERTSEKKSFLKECSQSPLSQFIKV